MKNKETLSQAGYEYIRFDKASRLHILRDKLNGRLEGWTANKGHASYGLVFRNTELEFVTSNVN